MSCSDLEDTSIDRFTDISFLPVESQLAASYNQLGDAFTSVSATYALLEHSTDEMQGPTRGADWDDGGRWRKLHTHEWTPTSVDVVDTWYKLNKGHALANEVIFLKDNKNPTTGKATLDSVNLAQARFIRAFYAFHIMDLFGQVPVKEKTGSEIVEKVLSRKEAATFLIAELKAAIPNLPAATVANSGRGSKAAAQTLLAKIYLNNSVYQADPKTPAQLGEFSAADMDAVIANCDAIINAGTYKLSTKYFKNFSPDNTEASTEIIFGIANTKGQSLNAKSSARDRYYMTTHYNQNPSGWNGFTTLSDFYNSFEEGDVRIGGGLVDSTASGLKYGWLVGQQYNEKREALKDRQGAPLVYTANCSLTNAAEGDGIRGIKYSPDFSDKDAPGNDYVFLRYADVLLMKAEALFRKGNASEALVIVNALRKVRGLGNKSTLTVADILSERGHEFYWEGWRRNDQIRFGKFNDPVVNREKASDGYRVLFPIPTKELEVNGDLKQNVGY